MLPGDVHGPQFILCLLFIKTEKVQEHVLYLNQILHHFDLIFFPVMNNNNFTKRGPQGPTPISLRSEYSSYN